MDDRFEVNSLKAQQNILDLCQDLKKQKFVKDRQVECWIEQFGKWYESTINKTFPISDETIFEDSV